MSSEENYRSQKFVGRHTNAAPSLQFLNAIMIIDLKMDWA